MLDYIDRMTVDAVQLGQEDIARLREVGYDDTAILQMTLIGAWFNYVNRVANGLGIHTIVDPDFPAYSAIPDSPVTAG